MWILNCFLKVSTVFADVKSNSIKDSSAEKKNVFYINYSFNCSKSWFSESCLQFSNHSSFSHSSIYFSCCFHIKITCINTNIFKWPNDALSLSLGGENVLLHVSVVLLWTSEWDNRLFIKSESIKLNDVWLLLMFWELQQCFRKCA